MEDGLVLKCQQAKNWKRFCLNPCCSGRWPCTADMLIKAFLMYWVLILVVVEDGLVHYSTNNYPWMGYLVLILVVVEDGLVRSTVQSDNGVTRLS